MSGYGMAVQQGAQLAMELATDHGNSAATAAVFSREYQKRKNNYAAMDARVAAERNISAVRRDKLLTDTHIQLKQNQVEAQIRANAAWIGAEGGSVDAVIYDSEANAAWRKADNAKKAASETSGQLHNVRSAAMSVDHSRGAGTPSLGANLLSAFSKYSVDDMNDLGTQFRGTPDEIPTHTPGTQMGAPMNINLNDGGMYA
jgi:hypothetical protein